jgi:hypothetical protein
MDRRDAEPNRQPGGGAADAPAQDWTEWAEIFARTVANLAAQLTVTQLQLRALGREVEERGLAEPGAVQVRLRRMAPIQTGPTLRENLGETLSEIVDVAALERDLIDYLTAPGADRDTAE